MSRDLPAPRWARNTLLIAAIYNIAWGCVVVLFPGLLFELAELEPPRYPAIWQCLGMVIGVYGVGYWIASRAPLRHWPIVLVGFLGKIFGPIGFVITALRGELDWSFGWTIVTNDLVWWVPFGAILWLAARHHMDPASRAGAVPAVALGEALAAAVTGRGESVADMSERRPVLVVLLRHSGCVFCREALRDLSAVRREVEQRGADIVLVHMGEPESFARLARSYGLGDLAAVADPEARLYRSLALARGTLGQLFGVRVFWRALLVVCRRSSAHMFRALCTSGRFARRCAPSANLLIRLRPRALPAAQMTPEHMRRTSGTHHERSCAGTSYSSVCPTATDSSSVAWRW